MIFTALCCYTTSGGLLHCRPYFAFDRRMHLERFSDALCTIATRSQKISTRIEWQFLQRGVHYERLRSSVCTCTWGGNDIDPFSRHVPFSAVSLMFMGYFLSIRIAQISCVHTLLRFHFVSPMLRRHLDSGGLVKYG
ncbi:hypothetical protein N431DRAFT_235791 [Stipitochalara longipes BDJ]|nr:hypothetical protein N431DRAFT_235791 [Stipitochalara longipes BDJ]